MSMSPLNRIGHRFFILRNDSTYNQIVLGKKGHVNCGSSVAHSVPRLGGDNPLLTWPFLFELKGLVVTDQLRCFCGHRDKTLLNGNPYRKKLCPYCKIYRGRHVERAGKAVRLAVKSGKMKPVSDCRCQCGSRATEYHHTKGYERKQWLTVVPICKSCHNKKTNHLE